MASEGQGRAAVNRRRTLAVVVAAQIALPATALLVRITQGVYTTPWGWQMFS